MSSSAKAMLLSLLVELAESSSDNDSTSSEEEIDLVVQVALARGVQGADDWCQFRENMYAPKDFLRHFRVNQNLVASLVLRYRQSEYGLQQSKFQEQSLDDLSIEQQLLIFLYYVGHRFAEHDVSARFGICLEKFKKVIKTIVRFLNSLTSEVIKWPPTATEQINVRDGFKQKGFQGVLGCLDIMDIGIDAPAVSSELYVNEEGYHSIRMQGVCDHTNRFTDIYVGQPGSVCASMILKASPLYPRLPELCRTGYILASNAFPPNTFVRTPYRDGNQLAKWRRQYNETHGDILATIHRTCCTLKQRFPCLSHLGCNDIVLCKSIVEACCVLHNLADQEDLQELESATDGGTATNQI